MNTWKRIIPLMLAFGLLLGAAGCGTDAGTATEEPAEETTAPQEEAQEEVAEEAAAADKPVLLVVSFGSSYNETRDITIGAIEEALQATYSDYEVRRAFTSQIVIDILEERESMEIDNMQEALDRLVADGVKEVVVQPTHVMPGFEYDDVMAELAEYEDKFESLKVGKPMLTDDADYDAVVTALAEETAEYNTEGTAIVFMGHGTHHDANSTYATLQQKLAEAGYDNYFIGTVEGAPLVDEVLEQVQATDAKKVVLLPLMIVAGDHATNDMAGDEEGSWKDVFTKAGYEVECVLKGLGQYPGIQSLLIEHTAAAVNG